MRLLNFGLKIEDFSRGGILTSAAFSIFGHESAQKSSACPHCSSHSRQSCYCSVEDSLCGPAFRSKRGKECLSLSPRSIKNTSYCSVVKQGSAEEFLLLDNVDSALCLMLYFLRKLCDFAKFSFLKHHWNSSKNKKASKATSPH